MHQLTWTLIVAVVTAALGCESGPEDRLASSRGVWRQLVRAEGETYSYAVPTSSFSGFMTKTVLQIEAGTVTYRRFDSSMRATDGAPMPLVLQWEERIPGVGSHPEGAPPVTVDELYQRCATEVLAQNSGANLITFELDDRGILEACVYAPKNCADDCAMGVWVSELVMGKTY